MRQLLHFSSKSLVVADVEMDAFLPRGVGGRFAGIVEWEIQFAHGQVDARLCLEG